VDATAEDRIMIRGVPLFSDLPDTLLDRITAPGLVFRYPRGVVLFEQGESPSYLHILLDGEIGLTAERGGEETVVEILHPGEIFIAAAVLADKPLLMGARVLHPARLLLLPADELRGQIRDMPELAYAMLTSLARHFRVMVSEIKDLKLKSSVQRLAGYLLTLTAGQARGPALVRLPHAKSVIAQRIGIRPETLSRHFTLLQAVGVTVHASEIAIRDVSRLAAFCHDAADDDLVW